MSWHDAVCEANGIAIHYLRTGGARPPVMMLHGLLGSGACWTPIARALEPDGDVVMPDARGHGASSAPNAGYAYDDHARDVEAMIRALDLDRPLLVGHSMGGMTAAVVARRAAIALRGVVLLDPTFLEAARQREVYASDVVDQHRRALARSRAELVAEARARHAHRSLEILELQAEARLRTALAAFEVLAPPNPDYRDVIRAIAIPCVLAIGDETIVTRAMAAELAASNPRVRIEHVAHATHGMPFDHPARTSEVIRTALG